jgi:hypothetical protein
MLGGLITSINCDIGERGEKNAIMNLGALYANHNN